MISISANDKPIQEYFQQIDRMRQQRALNEGQVAPHFANLLRHYAQKLGYDLLEQYTMYDKSGRKHIRVDGALRQHFMTQGVWEAKDDDDDLYRAIDEKIKQGYPLDNILIQNPQHAIVYQGGQRVFDQPIDQSEKLAQALQVFLNYTPPKIEQWQQAVVEFAERIPQYAQELITLIEQERQPKVNPTFERVFNEFADQCREYINPNISDAAIIEMIVQHFLTERIFRTVFNNPDFTRRNIIAKKLEEVIDALTSRHFDRNAFAKKLDRFYIAIEHAADSIYDYAEKQDFLNHIYERFFQGFAVQVADTHGIVYTPQPIVDFMVRSVDHLLAEQFNRRLADRNVHILDPFVGTGNFILRIMHQIAQQSRAALPQKYKAELHCNEVMLLPYYIASANIEHTYFELIGEYAPFEGIVFADTFELNKAQRGFAFVDENAQRAQEQQEQNITVIIGNPPYNAAQLNENDNNKNRLYLELDQRIRDTYAAASNATLKNKLYDPYVRAIRWASDRIGQEGIVAFVTNNSFIDALAFDGMRKCLAEEFDALYLLDLGGNVRKNPKISGTTHNVFGIQVGVVIALLIRLSGAEHKGRIYYHRLDDFWRKEQKYVFLQTAQDYRSVEWRILRPNKRHTWLTEGIDDDFEAFLPIGSKSAKQGDAEAIFSQYSLGVVTARDAWAYNFSRKRLIANMQRTIAFYNSEVARWQTYWQGKPESEYPQNKRELRRLTDDFVRYLDREIKWDGTLKDSLEKGKTAQFDHRCVRISLYRPFTKQYLYFDRLMNNSVYLQPYFFPTPEQEAENRVICVAGIGNRKGFGVLLTNTISNLDLAFEKIQCFPFYTYDEDGSNRQENISDWALEQFRQAYADETIHKWDIFYYVYAVLHHPEYRQRYQKNLKKQLPHIPFLADFWAFAEAGRRLGDLHVNYETVEPYAGVQWRERTQNLLDYRVEKMKLSKDKRQLVYNDYWVLEDIPPEVYEYKLGNRSALEWVVDRYRVTTDKRSGIVNDPNEYSEDERYILDLVRRVIAVSLETMSVIEELPDFELLAAETA